MASAASESPLCRHSIGDRSRRMARGTIGAETPRLPLLRRAVGRDGRRLPRRGAWDCWLHGASRLRASRLRLMAVDAAVAVGTRWRTHG